MTECRVCLLDTKMVPEISFDHESGECCYCTEYREKKASRVVGVDNRKQEQTRLVNQITAGTRGEYDCIIGLSGGADSTYVAYLVCSLGLKPLAVHLDNGWNTEESVGNIERTVRSLGIDLVTRVLDWQEFRRLQLAFLQSGTPDGEIPTDHAIVATLFREAKKFGISTIISGNNVATEGVMPESWAYGHLDWRYISNVNSRMGGPQLRDYPKITLLNIARNRFVHRIRLVSILNYFDYNKERALEVIGTQVGWRPYGAKHHESRYTKFYQSVVLPERHGIDKRYLHMSALILAGQMSKSEARKQVAPPPISRSERRLAIRYVSKKLGISETDLEKLIAMKPRNFRKFKNQRNAIAFLRKAVALARRAGVYER